MESKITPEELAQLKLEALKKLNLTDSEGLYNSNAYDEDYEIGTYGPESDTEYFQDGVDDGMEEALAGIASDKESERESEEELESKKRKWNVLNRD